MRFAATRLTDLVVAGTTATIAAISLNPSGSKDLTILNCGDSRTLVVGQPTSSDSGDSVIVFETRDYSLDDEIKIERLKGGKEMGLNYSVPARSMTSGLYV